MRSQLMAFLLVVTMVVIAIPLVSEAQSNEPQVTYLMGGVPQGKIVGGIVHNITITLNLPASNVTLLAYFDGFTESGIKTNYSWSYDSGIWKDNLYNYYLKPESDVYGSTYCFHVAIDSTANPGTWRFIIEVDGIEEYNLPKLVETPVAGISMSAPTFYPRIFPYGEGYYNSWNSAEPNNSTNLWTKNIGNVPLDLLISYDSFNSLFATSNGTGTFMPGEERNHYVEFQAQSWSPRKFTVKGLIHGTPQLVMTPDTISCIVAPQTTFDVVVTVARQGYEIYQMDGVTVQFKKFYPSKYKDDLFLDMYVTGSKSVYLSGEADNLDLNFIQAMGEDHTEPALMTLSEDVEQFVRANITCSVSPSENQASILAHVNFNLELEDQTATGSFTSTVVVASIPAGSVTPPILEPNVVVAIIIIATFGVIGAVMFMAHRKAEAEKRKELEERIRQKKEKSKNRR